jgi:3-oxoacyl-[acyl-carrier-protein] synthase-3
MIGIEKIASYVPSLRGSNFEKKQQFGIDDDFIEKKLGVHTVSQKSANEEPSDMCVRAFEALQGKSAIRADEMDCIVVCTQNPDGHGLPHTSAIVHSKIGDREDCAAFDISLGCSGYVYSLCIVQSFMATNRMKKGVLFTADPYSKIIDPTDKNTSLLFGDAATATLLSDNPTFVANHFAFGTRGNEHSALQRVGDHLRMNGRKVFNFSATMVPQQLTKVLKMSNNTLEDIDLLLLHQGSKYLIDIIQQRLQVDSKKVPSNLAAQGNTVSSSIPLLLESYLTQENYRKILISGFGVGLSLSSAILERI